MLQMGHPRAPPSCPPVAPAAPRRTAQPAAASCSAAPAARGASLPQQPPARASWLPPLLRRSGGLPASLRWRSHSDRGLQRQQTLPSTPLRRSAQTAGGLWGLLASVRCHTELGPREVPQGIRLCQVPKISGLSIPAETLSSRSTWLGLPWALCSPPLRRSAAQKAGVLWAAGLAGIWRRHRVVGQ